MIYFCCYYFIDFNMPIFVQKYEKKLLYDIFLRFLIFYFTPTTFCLFHRLP